MNTPGDILQYVLDNNYESDFMTAMAMHVGGYSISEIADGKFKEYKAADKKGQYKFLSNEYKINVDIEDDQIITAIINGLYISSFISRKDDSYNVHFMVHQYPLSMKDRFDEIIVKEVVQYMIMRTIVALRLDTEKKVDDYLKSVKP